MHSYTVKFITLSRLLLPELIKIRAKISPSNSSNLYKSKPAGPTRSRLNVKRFINPYVLGTRSKPTWGRTNVMSAIYISETVTIFVM
jgi:hypothetical protein